MATLYFDGASRGNPGKMGAGAVLVEDGKEIFSLAIRLSEKGTNNVAEWSALIFGLEEALKLDIRDLEVRGDSELVIKQVTGRYQVKKPHLIPLKARAHELRADMGVVRFKHVRREFNERADELSNIALDDPNSKVRSVPKPERRFF